VPAISDVGSSIVSMTSAKEIATCLEFVLKQMINNPVMLTQELLEFIGNNPRLQMLQTLHKAIARGKVNLATDVVA
jgi:hypothetical protein